MPHRRFVAPRGIFLAIVALGCSSDPAAPEVGVYHAAGSGVVDLRDNGVAALGFALVLQNRIAASRTADGEVTGTIESFVSLTEGDPQGRFSFQSAVDCFVIDGRTAWIGGRVTESDTERVRVGDVYVVAIQDVGGPGFDLMSVALARDIGDATCEDRPSGLVDAIVDLGDFHVAPGRLPAGELAGSIRVTVTTLGPDADSSGYDLGLDMVRLPIALHDTITLAGVFSPGTHTVRLDGVARNCLVNAQNPRVVSVRAGETTTVTFSVSCGVLTADVVVSTTTTGGDVDENGYLLRVGTVGLQRRVPANGTASIGPARVGTHVLDIGDMAPNCALEPSGAPEVTIRRDDEIVVVDLSVRCRTFGRLDVTTVTTGQAVDATGYSLTTFSVGPFDLRMANVGANATTTIARVTPGGQIVWLRGIAGNCAPRDSVVRRVDVPSGGTATVQLDVVCDAPGRVAFVAMDVTGNTDIYTVSSLGSSTSRLTHDGATDADPAWSPDGSQIAFASDRTGQESIYVMDENGANVSRLTTHLSRNYRPAWSPDGRRIAFVSERDGNAELYVMNADGTNVERLTNHPALDTDPDWSPDGNRIAFTSERDGNAEIYTLDLTSSHVQRVTNNSRWDGHPAWAPDGSKLAFSRDECPGFYWGACSRLVMVSDPTGANAYDIAVGEEPAWSRDGSRLAIVAFACSYYYYYDGCRLVGLGIAAPYRILGFPAYAEAWEPTLTLGAHRSPAWRP